MTAHLLTSRSEKEILWYQRRDALKAAAAWLAMGGLPAAMAQQRSNIVQLTGDALLNGARLDPLQSIQTGDDIQTGPGSNLVFVIGNSSFQVRQNSRLAVERGATLNAVSLLRLLTGAVASVWGKGVNRAIVMPTLTAGIRGTGVYAEIFAERDNRNYFCNCYGTVDMDAGKQKLVSQADYHQAFWADAEAKNGVFLTPAQALNHTDEELEFLARLIDQRTTWQIAGRKGNKDGSGKMTY
ncbi:MAG: iron dicitrate transport regulator FecR [Polaromonas sp.]|uniref:iron dicitrate transport regulator FecR n=1 Tax=Polaromonas sp. TaxID=1869339 RepID=UPI00272F8412|nr:iron dicitrate transport regulator FecR [Polaromonas sp.]MDP1740326.1 iron dicitrate transport regulator FecR [Polaromonas sp.]MDP1955458.1 iron dicitrate transport regulator FecR [Polaromonas sp.]MDP3357412.1 iron dicitrate transport regulator FecR [Polaromonas sp.]MDP3753206.1 iron dicitrate transport regulator FecR [Polaromonas sp.]